MLEKNSTIILVIKCKSSASVSSGVPNREIDESHMSSALEVYGTPDETRSDSFWYDFANETIKKYEVIHTGGGQWKKMYS